MLWITCGIIISYLLGSIPTAYLFGRLLKGVDIRNFGSGNVGATNALRLLGRGPALAVLFLDIFKGFAAVLFIGNILCAKVTRLPDEQLRVLLGLACISGHNWTIFLRFKGGKGIATTFGVLLGLAVKIEGLAAVLAMLILTWVLIFLIFRIISVASILGAVSLPVYIILFAQSKVLFSLSLVLVIFVLLRHKSNLKRIMEGKEPRLK